MEIDGRLNKQEIECIFKELNLSTGNMKLKKLIRKVDVDGDKHLDKQELGKLLDILYARKDIEVLFSQLTKGEPAMTLLQFSDFINYTQKE